MDSYECSICLEAIDNHCPVLECGHVFHLECINEWKRMSKNCPNCRYALTTLIHHKRASSDDVYRNMDVIYEIIKEIFKNSILETKICLNGEFIVYEIEMDEYLILIRSINVLYRGKLYSISIPTYNVKRVCYLYCFYTKLSDYVLRIVIHTGHAYIMRFQI